jgi:hypothetical protein
MSTGTYTECIYELMTFGIPRDAFPITDDGSLDLCHHHEILASLKHREEEEKEKEQQQLSFSPGSESSTPERYMTLVPGPMDVLMGRGRQPRYCPGAMRMHLLLSECSDAYEDGCKFEKTVIAGTTLKRMQNAGSRFLKAVPGGFVESDDAAARAKISHGFRSLRGKNKRTGDRKGGSTNNVKKRGLSSS